MRDHSNNNCVIKSACNFSAKIFSGVFNILGAKFFKELERKEQAD